MRFSRSQMQAKSSRRKSIFCVSCTSHIVQDGLTSTTVVLLPVIAQAFGLTYGQVGLLKGLNNASQAVLEFGSGWLAEWVGEARLIAIGLVLAGTGYLCLSAASSMHLIAICLIIIGAGTALHHAPSSSLIANSHPMLVLSTKSAPETNVT